MQVITLLSLVDISLPAYSRLFFQTAIIFANMDVFSGEAFFENNFRFKETDPLNEKFDGMGMSTQNYLLNTGSYYILLIGICVQFYSKRIINFICAKLARFRIARCIGIMIHEKKEDPIEMHLAAVKLFLEGYFDCAMANLLGLAGMLVGYLNNEFHLFWDSSHNIFCSTITIIWAILLLAFPVW